jgi:predicted AlkP superfamily phosphohydrolase/phosphomutase
MAPLVILGMDSGDPGLLQQWMAAGRLPNLAALQARGAHGAITGSEQVTEQGNELSLYSGVSRARHGYYNFRQLQPGTYDLTLFTPPEAGTLPFWVHLRGRDQRVLILDAAETSLVPGLPGLQVSNWNTHQPSMAILPARTEPASLLAEIPQWVGPQLASVEYHAHATPARDQHAFARLQRRLAQQGQLARRLLARGPFDLIVIEFFDAHGGGHRFWDYQPELQPAGAAPGPLTHAVREIYEAIDRELGLLLAALPAEANIIFYSPYGMISQYPTTGLTESFCRQLGYQAAPARAAAGPGFSPLSLARQLLPEALRVAISRRLSQPMQERLLADHFRATTDWSRTTAFAIPSVYVGLIQVNLQGREPQGTVTSADYPAVLDRLEADLKQLMDPLTGQPAVARVRRSVDLYGGGPPAKLPDLFVEWAPGTALVHRLQHPRAEITQATPGFARGSSHSYTGYLMAAGPAFPQRGDLGEISLLDFAPSCLHLLGVPAPADLSGRVSRALTGS